jgi:hypothetical protein
MCSRVSASSAPNRSSISSRRLLDEGPADGDPLAHRARQLARVFRLEAGETTSPGSSRARSPYRRRSRRLISTGSSTLSSTERQSRSTSRWKTTLASARAGRAARRRRGPRALGSPDLRHPPACTATPAALRRPGQPAPPAGATASPGAPARPGARTARPVRSPRRTRTATTSGHDLQVAQPALRSDELADHGPMTAWPIPTLNPLKRLGRGGLKRCPLAGS